MNSKDFIQQGRDRLQASGLVEKKISNQEGDLLPQIPGLGAAGHGISYARNREALSRYCIQPRIIGDDFLPDTAIDLFGQKLSMPILAAPMSGIATNLRGLVSEEEFLTQVLEGCVDAGTLGACGDSYDTTAGYVAAELMQTNKGIAVLKPRIFEEIRGRIEVLRESRVVAIGLDLDGVTGLLLETRGVSRKNKRDLKEIRSLFLGPMFLKGILSVEDASAAYEAGFDGVVISNHGGRSIDYCPAPATVLPAIAKKFKGKLKIIVDGGIKNGYDAFIYLALGADAVMVGRTVLYGAVGGGRTGVKATVSLLASELTRAMVVTGCKRVDEIGENTIKLYA